MQLTVSNTQRLCRGVVAAGRGGAGASTSKQANKPAVLGPGAKMIEDMRKKGKPIDPKMEQMAAWLDNLAKDAGGDGMGEVGLSCQYSHRLISGNRKEAFLIYFLVSHCICW